MSTFQDFYNILSILGTTNISSPNKQANPKRHVTHCSKTFPEFFLLLLIMKLSSLDIYIFSLIPAVFNSCYYDQNSLMIDIKILAHFFNIYIYFTFMVHSCNCCTIWSSFVLNYLKLICYSLTFQQ